MARLVQVLRTGRLDYEKGLKLQKYISGTYNKSPHENDFKDVLILTEHNPVYTIGVRTKDYTLRDENKLKNLGAQFYKTNRGGLITFHGPGQLVAYPILHLKHFKPSIRWYVEQLEMTIINLCSKFGIQAGKTKDTGIWVDNERKICAIGIHASRYITTHGIALNCNTDLTWFDHIVPCGIEGKTVTSISKEIMQDVQVEQVIPKFLNSFSEYFKCDLLELDQNEKMYQLD